MKSQANAHPKMGGNKTGMTRAPAMAAEMIAMPEELLPPPGKPREVVEMRVLAAKEAFPQGTLPPAKSKAPPLLLDKMGERLAFERTGVRLYETLLVKHAAYGSFPGGPTAADLTEILKDEQKHFEMLHAALSALGGDTTVVTPSANLAATISAGVCMAINDPRTTLVEGLEAILVAELSDNACWEALAELAMQAGLRELAEQTQVALAEEQEHLVKVQSWLAAAQGRSPSQPRANPPKESADEAKSRARGGSARTKQSPRATANRKGTRSAAANRQGSRASNSSRGGATKSAKKRRAAGATAAKKSSRGGTKRRTTSKSRSR